MDRYVRWVNCWTDLEVDSSQLQSLQSFWTPPKELQGAAIFTVDKENITLDKIASGQHFEMQLKSICAVTGIATPVLCASSMLALWQPKTTLMHYL